VLQEIKTTVYAPLGVPSLETKPLGVKVGVNVGTAAARAGIIGNYATSEADRVIGLIDPIHGTIRSWDAAFQVHRLSLCHRLDYLAQIADPLLGGVQKAFAEVDRTLRRAEVHLFGVGP